jgi:hypothetical protein
VAHPEGEGKAVKMHDVSTSVFRKGDANHCCRDRRAALTTLERARTAGEIVTGLICIEEANELHEVLGTPDRRPNDLSERKLCPR